MIGTSRRWLQARRQRKLERATYRAQQQAQQHEDARHFTPGEGGSPLAGEFGAFDALKRGGGGGGGGG